MKKIALEVEGGIWIQGRHSRGAGMLKDMEKYNAAAAAGWRLFRTTPKQLRSAELLNMLADAVVGARYDPSHGYIDDK